MVTIKVRLDTYVIASINRPILFGTESGDTTDEFQEAMQFATKKLAEEELNKYDEPEYYEVIKGTLEFDF